MRTHYHIKNMHLSVYAKLIFQNTPISDHRIFIYSILTRLFIFIVVKSKNYYNFADQIINHERNHHRT